MEGIRLDPSSGETKWGSTGVSSGPHNRPGWTILFSNRRYVSVKRLKRYLVEMTWIGYQRRPQGSNLLFITDHQGFLRAYNEKKFSGNFNSFDNGVAVAKQGFQTN